MRLGRLPIVCLAALAACDVADTPTAAAPPQAPARAVSHWPTGGTWGFYFLPWEAPAGYTPAPFDGTLSPVVRVCRVTNGACGPTLATFSRTSGSYGRRVTVNAAEESYDVDWPTGSTGAAPGQVYRVSVHVGARQLGFADVRMITSWWEFFTTDTDEYVPWVAGWELPVSFRIAQGIPGSVTVSSTSITVDVADGKAVTAQALDLRGQPLPAGDVGWEIVSTSPAPGPVAVLDSGMVVGENVGTAILYVWAGDVTVQVPITVTDTRRPWTAVSTPDFGGNRAVWGTSATSVYAAHHTGVSRYDGAAWRQEEAVRWRSMHDVLGFGATSVWAVGDGGTIVRFDGTAWSGYRFDGAAVAPHPLNAWEPPARRIDLRALWGSAAGSILAVGDSGTALRWDGTQWTPLATGVTAGLTDAWGSAANNVYATTADGRILRYNGTAFSVVSGVQAPGALNAVWGSSASNVYAVGAGGIVYRHNGASWQRIRLPTRRDLYAVWGTSATNVFIAGEGGTIYRFDGTKWTPEKSPIGGSQLYGLWGAPTGEIFAAGAGGILKR